MSKLNKNARLPEWPSPRGHSLWEYFLRQRSK